MKHIVRTGMLSFLSLRLPHASPVYAEDSRQEPQKTEFSVGVAGGYADSSYRGKSADWMAVPLAQLETKRFYIRGLSVGIKLYTSADQSQEVLLGVTYLRDHGLKPSDLDDVRLERLDRRENAVMADISHNLCSPCSNLETQMSHDVPDMNKGMQAQVQYSYSWQPTSKLPVKPVVGVSYSDRKSNRYYYGINANEVCRSGLNAYWPKFSVHSYIGLETQYSFTPKFGAFAGVLVEALPSTVKNSPMSDGKYRIEGTAGSMYRF